MRNRVQAYAMNPMICIPGMMLDAGLYTAQLSGLIDLDVCVADITGSDSIEALAASILASAPARFALVGMSMGGIVALEVIRQSPQRVTHLALIGTTSRPDRPERRAIRADQMERVRNGALLDVITDTMKSHYLSVTNQSNLVLQQAVLEMALKLGPDVFMRQSIALRDRPDLSRTLPDIRCPALVLCGREDRLCSVEVHAEVAATIPVADLMILCKAGHLAPMERPEAVTHALRRLMARSCA